MDVHCIPSFDVDRPVTYASLLCRYVDDASLSRFFPSHFSHSAMARSSSQQ